MNKTPCRCENELGASIVHRIASFMNISLKHKQKFMKLLKALDINEQNFDSQKMVKTTTISS